MQTNATLLVIEDDVDVAEMLGAYFRSQDYEVVLAHEGRHGLQVCQQNRPDLIILDIRLPDIDGFEVARQLAGSRKTQDIPIIFLTEKRARGDRLHGLSLQAVDYITKPFDMQELRLRVRNALRREMRGSITNPVTNLPEGSLVDEKLRECLQPDAGQNVILLVVGLLNYERFCNDFGFLTADDLLRSAGFILQDALHEVGNLDDFLGHLERTQFILFTDAQALTPLRARIVQRLDATLDFFFRDQDRQEAGVEQHRVSYKMSEIHMQSLAADSLESLKEALQQVTREV